MVRAIVGGRGRVRKSTAQARLIAISTAAMGALASLSARADITNGFSGFATPNINTTSSTTGIGYSANGGSFELTNDLGGEAVSGFDSTEQNITSFDATFDYTASGAADGAAFVIQSNGTTALGGGGGSGGYQGMSNSAALEFEFYNETDMGTSVGGAVPAYGSTGNITLNSGDSIQATLEYFNNTLTANLVDLSTGRAYAKIFPNFNIPSAIGGGSNGYVGFTGGTGGSASTQTVSNFTYFSGISNAGARIYNPIAISGYNQAGIITVAKGTAALTATMDNGTNLAAGGDTWYELGWNTYNSSTGLPTSGSTFTSQADSSHIFQMANYSGDDVFMVTGSSNGSSTATINFSNPAAYSALSFLTASGNGPSSFKVTINYADNANASSGLSVISPDWFNGTPSAYFAGGRATPTALPSSKPDNYQSGNPNLYEEDLVLPDSTDPISSVTMNWAAGGQIMVFGVSGVVANNAPLLIYTGAAIPGKFDNSTINFNLSSGGTFTPSAFSNGDQVVFDDTAVDTNHNITVASVAGGILVDSLIFNNTTATNPYTFTGAGIGGPGGISINDGGTVVLENPNTFSGGAFVNDGTLVINPGGKLASSNISVSSGSTLQVSGGTLSGSAISLSDSGTVSYSGNTLSLASLSGSGSLSFTNSSNTTLTLTGSGTFSGPITQNGQLGLTINANGSTVSLTGSNTYSGATVLKAGTLLVGPNSYGSGPINLSGGAIGSASGNVNISNLIIGGALLAASGGNSLEISNSSNTFTGPVVVQSGALLVDNAGALGATTTIDVASGATLEDNSGNPLGAGTTMVLSGAGVGGNGALRSADGATATWEGNINVSGPSQISPGYSGTFTLTGAITGNGPVSFVPNSNSSSALSTIVLSPPTPTSNTYTGESQVYGGANTLIGFTVQLGNHNGFSPAAGLNFNGGTGPVTVDLFGFNQSVTYLAGSGPSNSVLTNSNGSTLSTLTISNGNNTSAVPQTFGTPITGNIAVVKTGGGNQALAGVNTYGGGTTISGGTLTIPTSSGLGTGAVTLSGGTLALSAPSSFSGFGTSVAQGSASISGGTVQLTPASTAGAVFSSSPVLISDSTGFSCTFTYTPTPIPTTGYQYGGASFIIGKTPTADTGVTNSEFGNSTNGNSVEIDNQIYWDNGDYPNDNGMYTAMSTNGQMPPAANVNPYAFNTWRADPIQITLNYSNGVLTETLVDTDPTGTFTTVQYAGPDAGEENPSPETFTYDVDIAQILGGSANGTALGYVGFTAGATGSSTETISNFSFNGGGTVPVSLIPNGNAVIAAAGTSSVIEVGTSSQSNTESIPSLTLNNGSSVALTITGSTTRAVLAVTGAMSISQNSSGAFNAQLDIGSNDLDLSGGSNSLAAVTAMVAQGYANGKWNGQGIASSAAAADTTHLTALGVILNDNGSGTPLYGNGGGIASTFDGSTPADGDILVKYTYYGDANLDGSVNASDYSLIDNGYLNHLTGWYNGDFNYDGVVNGSDYTLIDNAFNMQGAANPSTEVATEFGTASSPGAVVPEPATLGLLGLAGMGLLRRRRQPLSHCQSRSV